MSTHLWGGSRSSGDRNGRGHGYHWGLTSNVGTRRRGPQFLRDGFSYAPNPCLALGISPISQREPSYPCESRY